MVAPELEFELPLLALPPEAFAFAEPLEPFEGFDGELTFPPNPPVPTAQGRGLGFYMDA